ncbi:MAG: small subunit ribosomal protein S16 [Planctomycetota bacterium]|nr:MAG: small subunit ribosomal protein S16 [Planctomycetota bacterium]
MRVGRFLTDAVLLGRSPPVVEKEHLVSVRIRMTRMGRKHRPFYRIVVIDRQKAREGKAIEEVGTYDPMVKDKSARVKLKMERIEYWQSVGALPSDRVATLIKKVKTNRWTDQVAAPALTPQKPPPAPAAAEAPAEEAPAEGGEAS